MRAWHLDHFGGRPTTINALVNMHRMRWAKQTADDRAMWEQYARHAGIPKLERGRVIVTPLHKDRRSPQDVAACAPAAKAAVDGLVDAGVFSDDDASHVIEVVFRPPWICGADGLRLTVEEAA